MICSEPQYTKNAPLCGAFSCISLRFVSFLVIHASKPHDLRAVIIVVIILTGFDVCHRSGWFLFALQRYAIYFNVHVILVKNCILFMKIVKIVSFCQIACLYIILTVCVVFGRSTEELKTDAYLMSRRSGTYCQREHTLWAKDTVLIANGSECVFGYVWKYWLNGVEWRL